MLVNAGVHNWHKLPKACAGCMIASRALSPKKIIEALQEFHVASTFLCWTAKRPPLGTAIPSCGQNCVHRGPLVGRDIAGKVVMLHLSWGGMCIHSVVQFGVGAARTTVAIGRSVTGKLAFLRGISVRAECPLKVVAKEREQRVRVVARTVHRRPHSLHCHSWHLPAVRVIRAGSVLAPRAGLVNHFQFHLLVG